METFFELSLDMMVVANGSGYFERINPAFQRVLGYPAKVLQDRPFMEFVHPDDRESTEQVFGRLMTEGAVVDFENRYRCADGEWKWLSWRSRLDHNTGRVYAVARDVTAQKDEALHLQQQRNNLQERNARLERRVHEGTQILREVEGQFSVLVDGVRDYALIMLDADGRIVSWNQGATRTKRFQADEILGRPVECLYTPEDIQAGKPACHLATAAREGRLEDEGWRMRGDGTRYRAHVVLTRLHDANGVHQGFAKITRDISREYETMEQLKRQRSLLETILDNLAEGVVACDAQERLMFFNKTARRWHGQSAGTEAAEEWPEAYDLFEADGVTPLPLDHLPLLRAARGEQVRDQEMAIVAKGQAPRFVLVSGDPMTDGAGNPSGAVVVMYDITERRLAERAALRTQRVESIGMLAGGVAHDLNNALAPVLMAIELLRAKYTESSDMLDMIECSARRGAGMVKQLLTFAKGARGDEVAVNLRHVLREIQSLVEGTFPKNIRVSVSTDGGVGCVIGDPTQLHQVLLNLCVNARDAMPAGGDLCIRAAPFSTVTDRVPADLSLQPGDYVELLVGDTGEGIPAEHLEKVFDPFFTTKEADKGTGLGLATVHSIVRSHGGGLRIESQVGQGTRFFVYLPTAGEPETAGTNSPFAPGGLEGRGRKVLLVDDEASIREIGRSVITSLGFHVITAADGAQAFLLLQEHGEEIELVITDKDMPEMDGPTLHRHMASIAKRAVWVLASGKVTADEEAAFKAAGIKALLNKPFSQGELVKVLQRVLA